MLQNSNPSVNPQLQAPKLDSTEREEKIDYNHIQNSKIIIGTYQQAPKFLQDNEFIINGYLINCNTYSKIFKSLFICHNETVNIWTHLLGALFFMFLIWYTSAFITNFNSQLAFVKEDISLIEKKYLNDINDTNLTYISSKTFNNIYYSIKNMKIDLENLNYKNIYENSLNQLSLINNSNISDISDINKTNDNIIDSNINTNYSFNHTFSSLKKDLNTLNKDIVDLIKLLKEEDIKLDLEIEEKPKKKLGRWPLFIIISAAISCLTFSATFHSVGNLSSTHHNILNRFDYGGISLLISGSCYPPYYYFFYFSQKLKIFYLSEITIFGLGTFFYSLTDDFNKPKRRALRGSIFLIFGLCTGIPIIHLSLFAHKIKGYSPDIKLINWYLGGISYVSGALIYMMRYPEKKCLRTFDYIGASHQLFHILVFLGALFHFLGSIDAYNYRFGRLYA
jgi:adiponectin receptor